MKALQTYAVELRMDPNWINILNVLDVRKKIKLPAVPSAFIASIGVSSHSWKKLMTSGNTLTCG